MGPVGSDPDRESKDHGDNGIQPLLGRLIDEVKRNEIEKIILEVLERQRNGEAYIVLTQEAADKILEKVHEIDKYAS